MMRWASHEFLYALLLLSSDDVKTLTVGVYLLFQRHLVRAIVAGAVK